MMTMMKGQQKVNIISNLDFSKVLENIQIYIRMKHMPVKKLLKRLKSFIEPSQTVVSGQQDKK